MFLAVIWKTAHSQLPGPQISSRARNPPGFSSPPARRFGWVCFTFLSTSLPSLPICGARVVPGILVPCDGDASCPWEVWQRPESQGKLCGRAWRLEQPPTSQSSSPTTGPSFLLHLSLSLLPSTSPCQRLCKELELADTLISCRDCSTRAGLPGEGRKKEQQNFVPCHQGASFVRDASLLSTGPSGLLSCFATWVLLAVTGARAVFELWSSCWVGASPLGLPSGLLLADGDVLLLVSSFPALWKEKKKRACSPFLPWCLLSGSSQHSECKSCSAGRVPAFANPQGLPPALRSEEPGCASPKALSCFCVLGCWDRPAGQCRGFLYLCLASSVTLPGEISSSARCLNWRGAEGPPCPCGVRGGLLQPPAPAAASPPELFLFLEKCKSRSAVPREEAAPTRAVWGREVQSLQEP